MDSYEGSEIKYFNLIFFYSNCFLSHSVSYVSFSNCYIFIFVIILGCLIFALPELPIIYFCLSTRYLNLFQFFIYYIMLK